MREIAKLFAHSSIYKKYRPSYPSELFEYFAQLVHNKRLAWDAGTGSGQAAVHLSRHFEKVLATDINAGQLEHAERGDNITYLVGKSDDRSIGVAEGSVDFISVAQAVHWFDLDVWNAIVQDTLAPGGVYACYGYNLPIVDDTFDSVLLHYYNNVIGEYWMPQRRIVEDEYIHLQFPKGLVEIQSNEKPDVFFTDEWDLEQVLGYLDSWSSTQIAKGVLHRHPLFDDAQLMERFRETWGSQRKRTVRFPIFLRIGRKPE